jgi:hydroxyacylglutathione hydrolase
MSLVVTAVPAFADNYIWLIANGRSAVLVDPGEAGPAEAALAAEALVLEAILLTHHHADHVGGAAALAARYSVPVYAPVDERIEATFRVRDGDRISLPGIGATFEVMEIHGHTRTHIAFFDGSRVYCGDTLFAAGCGRLFEGTPTEMHRSLTRLAALPAATEVFCGHEYTVGNLRFAQAVEPGNEHIRLRLEESIAQRARGLPTVPSRIDEERATNPFLRVDVPTVRAAASRFAGRELDDPAEVFAALRGWKDGFVA